MVMPNPDPLYVDEPEPPVPASSRLPLLVLGVALVVVGLLLILGWRP